MTLLTICQQVIDEIAGFSRPGSIVNNTDPNVRRLLALADRTGRHLLRHDFQELLKSYTFTTTASTATYALPSDFRRFANMSFWDRTNLETVKGPVSPAEWQVLKSSNVAQTTIARYFRIADDLFTIHPTPTVTGETIAYDYWSNAYCESSGGTAQSAWAADTDVPRLDEDLFILGIKWRFRQAHGLPFETEFAEFNDYLMERVGASGGKQVLDMNGGYRLFADNIPETGYGT